MVREALFDELTRGPLARLRSFFGLACNVNEFRQDAFLYW